MQVTIKHREESAGLAGKQRNYFVDCDVRFSEEERATIAARGLQQQVFEVGGAMPPRPRSHFIGAGFLRGFAPIVGIAGVILVFFIHPASLLIVAAPVMYITGRIMDRRPTGHAEPQQVTLGRLLGNPRLTIYAYDPAEAARVDDELRETLGNIKNRLIINAEVRERQTFEL